jgi:predicted nicotinamide N-methyase
VSVNDLPRPRCFLERDEMNPTRVESPYDGPVVESSIRVAGRSIKLVRPVEPDRLLDAPEVIAWNAQDDYMPYWAYLWPGALLLGEAVAALDVPEGTEALEIGCGLGLSGLVAVALGFRVRFTDQDRTAFRFIEASARANGFDPSSYSTALLDWRNPPNERYPLILGADVTYEKRLVPLVARVVAAMLEPGGLALISDPNRVSAEGLGEALKALGLATEAVAVEGNYEGLGHVRGTIHRAWHPRL